MWRLISEPEVVAVAELARFAVAQAAQLLRRLRTVARFVGILKEMAELFQNGCQHV